MTQACDLTLNLMSTDAFPPADGPPCRLSQQAPWIQSLNSLNSTYILVDENYIDVIPLDEFFQGIFYVSQRGV